MAASDQSVPAGSTPSAQVVGNAFVHQYYHILHHSPQLVYRFYQEKSKLGRPEPEGLMSSVTGMDAINETIMSTDYSDHTAAIKNVDAQESHDGGVIVLVTGCLSGKKKARNFTQSFFLAPQDKGYYVLNDIFRYIDAEGHQLGSHDLTNEADAVTPDQEKPAVQDPQVLDRAVSPQLEEEIVNEEEVYNPSEGEDGSVVEEEIPVEEVINEVVSSSHPIAAESSSLIPQEDAPKKSYASIVKVMKENAANISAPTAVPLPARQAPVNPERQIVSTPAPAPASEIASGSVSVECTIAQEAEADGFSIYIRNLPLNATPAQLEVEFKKFGPIKPDGIQVRSHKQQGFCFGFVEFEVASAVQSAIEASPIMIGGRQAFIEEKRPTGSRVISRGRYISGRGGGFRNEGVRGRGNYGAGRGYGRGYFSGRGGGRGSSNRGTEVGYQRVDQPGSIGSRVNHTGPVTDNAPSKNIIPPLPAPA